MQQSHIGGDVVLMLIALYMYALLAKDEVSQYRSKPETPWRIMPTAESEMVYRKSLIRGSVAV